MAFLFYSPHTRFSLPFWPSIDSVRVTYTHTNRKESEKTKNAFKYLTFDVELHTSLPSITDYHYHRQTLCWSLICLLELTRKKIRKSQEKLNMHWKRGFVRGMEPYRPKRKDEVRVFPFKWFSTGFSGAFNFFQINLSNSVWWAWHRA